MQGCDGRLGHGDNVCYLYPKKVESLAHVTQAACGSFRKKTPHLLDLVEYAEPNIDMINYWSNVESKMMMQKTDGGEKPMERDAWTGLFVPDTMLPRSCEAC